MKLFLSALHAHEGLLIFIEISCIYIYIRFAWNKEWKYNVSTILIDNSLALNG